ncbi:winged helix-turn-helix domain-containing protein [Nonomuraea sp. NPDC026600]|uniref:winged helix-turn-helix domain-containing protein n=1 Tax=Nonomuraea sp. NPDC026600 TaxID=3155363 RepID=UPI0033D2B987
MAADENQERTPVSFFDTTMNSRDSSGAWETGRLDGLIEELAGQGLLFGRGAWLADRFGAKPGTVEEALPSVRKYLDRPVFPEGAEFPETTTAGLAVAIVQGARRALEDVQAIERAAAGLAREHGITVRQLAAAAGISERAANDRYRRLEETVTVYCGACGGAMQVPRSVFDPNRDLADLYFQDCPGCGRNQQING